jgi:hypothetical protein
MEEIFQSDSKMNVRSNGGTMVVKQKGKMPGYKPVVWFSRKAITNIISIKNLTRQYCVTYDSDDQTFVVHPEKAGKPNMQVCMHSSGLHYFDPRDESFMFVGTIEENKKNFTKRQIQEQKSQELCMEN